MKTRKDGLTKIDLMPDRDYLETIAIQQENGDVYRYQPEVIPKLVKEAIGVEELYHIDTKEEVTDDELLDIMRHAEKTIGVLRTSHIPTKAVVKQIKLKTNIEPGNIRFIWNETAYELDTNKLIELGILKEEE